LTYGILKQADACRQRIIDTRGPPPSLSHLPAIASFRERTAAEVEKLGELAAPALRRTLQNKPTLEQRRRIEPILTRLEAVLPTGEALRSLRAVRVLEHAGTVEARRLLRELAAGAEDARLTQEAKAALARQSQRRSRAPPREEGGRWERPSPNRRHLRYFRSIPHLMTGDNLCIASLRLCSPR
jgi:hypothetical protein